MSGNDKVFDGSIPHFYDTFMVPLIFEVYADDLAARVAKVLPLSVLETASGSGVVSRALAKRLSMDARYVVTDLNQPMIDHAASKQPGDHAIEWLQADALDLPFGDEEFDVVACQFGAMFFPDRSKGYAEARRVLKPGGRYFFSVWDKIENNELADIVTREAGAVFPYNPPRFLARTPHGYFDRELIRADLQRAGFSDIVIEVSEEKSIAPSAGVAAKAYCHGTPLRKEIEDRDPALLDHVMNTAAAAIETRFGKGPIVSKISALLVTATK
jgi:ubiquinone/menaquinone biosynthesis C-methylase UbiE